MVDINQDYVIQRLREIRMFTPAELMRSKIDDPLLMLDNKIKEFISELEGDKQ